MAHASLDTVRDISGSGRARLVYFTRWIKQVLDDGGRKRELSAQSRTRDSIGPATHQPTTTALRLTVAEREPRFRASFFIDVALNLSGVSLI